MPEKPGVGCACVAEVIGTFILVFFGVGSVHVAVLTGALQGLWQVAVIWGAAVTLAIYATGQHSGAHLNPAVTIAFASWRGFPWARVGPYIASQMAGAFIAAAVLYALFSGSISAFEAANGITRGSAGSEASAMMYGEYFPNPTATMLSVAPWQAMLAEGIGTLFLVFFIFTVVDDRNDGIPGVTLAPVLIGAALGMLIMMFATLSQAGLNPARDFGPRLFSLLAGWGEIAIPGPRGGFFTVYILAPVVGGLLGGALYESTLRRRAR
jgi:glycerol uptake facilitator protein